MCTNIYKSMYIYTCIYACIWVSSGRCDDDDGVCACVCVLHPCSTNQIHGMTSDYAFSSLSGGLGAVGVGRPKFNSNCIE